jgi:hypothetical protein
LFTRAIETEVRGMDAGQEEEEEEEEEEQEAPSVHRIHS